MNKNSLRTAELRKKWTNPSREQQSYVRNEQKFPENNRVTQEMNKNSPRTRVI